MSIEDEAAEMARTLHADQRRKGTDIPYFDGHLAPVADLVRQSDGSEEQIAAAYLHDAVEDRGGLVVLEQIRAKFGDRVADMVEDLSDSVTDTTDTRTEKEPWTLRKTRYLAGLATKPVASLEVSIADKLHNATSILDDYRALGDELWSRFNQTNPAYHLWYYQSLVEVYRRRIPEHPLFDRLDSVVAALTDEVRAGDAGIDSRLAAVRAELE